MELKEEQLLDEQESSENKGASYPAETVNFCHDFIVSIMEKRGEFSNLSSKDLGIILGKSKSFLVLKLSTSVQYGLLINNHGRGYSVSELFKKLNMPVYDHDKTAAAYEAIYKPSLYKKLIDLYNGKTLPSENGLANLLINNYGINKNSAGRAAKVFYENCHSLNAIENNRLKLLPPLASGETIKQPIIDGEETPEVDPLVSGLFNFPIALSSNKKVVFTYPKNGLTKKDITELRDILGVVLDGIESRAK